jgi:trimeric autotransporter adhesin
MSCTPTRILLSNSATTTMTVTLSTDPGDGTTVTFQVDGLGITETETTTSAVAVFTIAANTASNNSLWDATLQVGTNTAVEAVVQAVETNDAQAIGVTLSSTDVTYCSPLAGGSVTSIIAGTNVTISPVGGTGAVTVNAVGDGTGTVTSVATGAGLTGGTITTTGTIAHAAGSFVGSEEYPVRIVVDTFGHVQVNESETTAGAYRTATGTDDADNLISGTVALARLPALAAAYTGQIETIIEKTYTIDPGVVAGRTITSFYARSGAGTCTATLKNAALTVGVVSVTTSSTTAVISNTTVAADSALTIVITSNVAATDVVFSVEFTQ